MRRRRGPDFFQNYFRSLQPALNGDVDIVIHGGDVFFRSRVFPKIVHEAFQPLIAIADKGIPVYLVPGNHERSNIPVTLLETHRNIHIFDQPKTFVLETKGRNISLSGFPFYRSAIRKNFETILNRTDFQKKEADVRLLCMRQSVEGAQVGVQNYTFRNGDDVIRGSQIPGDYAAILSGHIHRFQMLKKDLAGRELKARVFYPGAIEQTSFAERSETKGNLIFEIWGSENNLKWKFVELLTRPMMVISIKNNFQNFAQLRRSLRDKIENLPPNSIVQIRILPNLPPSLQQQFTAHFLRTIAPETMNTSLSFHGKFK